jgi:hypothetical protein
MEGNMGDAYEPRISDAPDALRVSNVVLVDTVSGFHLAQWNVQ